MGELELEENVEDGLEGAVGVSDVGWVAVYGMTLSMGYKGVVCAWYLFLTVTGHHSQPPQARTSPGASGTNPP
jgi:hypothetical protein